MAGRGGRMRVPQQGVAILRPHGGRAAAASMVVAPAPPIIEQKLAAQHLEIQRLLTENQRFAATHVALRQEVAQLRQLVAQKDARVAALEGDVEQARSDAKAVNSHRQDLVVQVTQLTQDLHRCRVEAQQMLVLRAENDTLRQELQRLKATYEPGGSFVPGSATAAAKDHSLELAKEEKLRSFPVVSSSASSTTSSVVSYPSTATTVSYPVAAAPTPGASYPVANGTSSSGGGGETWTTHYAPNGALFYYNTVTGVTQWEKPASLQLHPSPPAPTLQQTMQQVLVHHQQQQQAAAAAAAAAASAYQLGGHPPQFPQQLLFQQTPGPGGAAPSSGNSANLSGRNHAPQPSPSQNPLSFLARATSGVGNPATRPDAMLSHQIPSSPSVTSRPQGATLSVYGISADYRDSDLADLFKPYGSVLYAKVATAKEMAAGQPCGTVTLDSRRSAEAAMAAMNGVSISGCALEIKLQRDQDTDFPAKQKSGAYRY